MKLGLKEKVVLVTGASKGIGKAIAVAFAAEGSRVVLNARNQQELEQVVQEIRQSGGYALALAADVTSASEYSAWHSKLSSALAPSTFWLITLVA